MKKLISYKRGRPDVMLNEKEDILLTNRQYTSHKGGNNIVLKNYAKERPEEIPLGSEEDRPIRRPDPPIKGGSS